jgi:TetR/AcrR family transcriptional repressor of nem operon
MGRVSDAKQRLLHATLELIWRQSYGAATVDSICREAGVKKGSFYHFFPSKTDLVVAALESHYQAMKPDLDRVFDPAVPPATRLRHLFEWLYRKQSEIWSQTGRVPGCPYCSVGSETSNCERAICNKAQELIAHNVRYLEGTVRDLKSEGAIQTEDPHALAEVLFAYIHGVLAQARIKNDPELIRGMEARAFKMIGLAGAGAGPTRAAPGAIAVAG